MSGGTLIWAHDDMLGPHQPPFRAAPEAPCVVVLDPAVIAARLYGLKRLVFVTECALALPNVRLRKGETVAQVLAAADELGCARVATVTTPCPQLSGFMDALAGRIELERMAPDPFVVPRRELDLKRFMRFWKKVEDVALLPTERQS